MGGLQARSQAEKSDTDEEYSRKKKDAVTIRGRKAHRLHLNEKHFSEDAHETGHSRSKHHKPWSSSIIHHLFQLSLPHSDPT